MKLRYAIRGASRGDLPGRSGGPGLRCQAISWCSLSGDKTRV